MEVLNRSKLIYTSSPGKLEQLLRKIPNIGTPHQVNYKWLEIVGFKKKSDYSFIPVFKAVGFINEKQQPTPLWKALRIQDTAMKMEVASAIKTAYKELFEVYPDAEHRSHDELTSFFMSSSGLSKRTVQLAVLTFKVLVKFADFSQNTPVLKNDSFTQNQAPLEDQILINNQTGLNLQNSTVTSKDEFDLTFNNGIKLILPEKFKVPLALGEIAEVIKQLNELKI